MKRRVVITGMGLVTPLGDEVETVWQNLLSGKSGVEKTKLFDADTFPTTFSAQVQSLNLEKYLGDDAKKHDGASRNSQFALGAAASAWTHAELSKELALDPTRVGVYLGGGEGPLDFDHFAKAAVGGCQNEQGEISSLNIQRWVKLATEFLSATYEMEQEPNLAGSHLAVQFNAQGPNINTLTACAASTQAIGEASQMIINDEADVMISGGTHSMVHPLGVTGFNRLTALSTRNDSYQTASRPFDRTRDGFVLGEGSGILILEELEHARRRGVNILAEITGYGSTADAFRITDIHEDGRGATAAMNAALTHANLKPQQIDYISAHGTSTEENDKIETRAIKKVFGDHASKVAISSIKSMIGHLIAAAGAVELITCVLAIRDGVVPPTMNYENPDPNCNLDYVPNEARKMPIRTVLSNSFGFGGQNDSLVVQSFQDV